ncbi:GNAT family N-acetyltransferase [Aquabacter sp. L1I39]|uniref:GNAT family N-acetyltransferase n=1 Tax=Aquabacter sp. L1I39 TaxID=2820278 RepID=UPI001ADBF007|nr:GNAT family N-acetyltransferase [Aquabacter sp. L1I39]QTL01997.1 GNAT family N-acetyltransferase [Aquabacter sp. L1I39]
MTIVECPSQVLLQESSIPVLETERLVLRMPRVEDVPAIAALANNVRIAEMTANLPHPYRPSDARAFVDTLAATANGITFAIFLKQEGGFAFAGMCGFGQRKGESAPEIGYWIGEPHWGRGIATEAVRAIIDFVFSETDHDRILGAARVVNPASRRVLEKCAFQWCGVGLCRVKALGASVPVDRFQLERRTWASLRAWGSTALPHHRALTH